MVLKEVNWVHNDKIRSNGLKRSQLGTQYKYRGYLFRQVVFCFTENPWISVFDVVLLNVELEMWFFAVSDLKSAQKLQFLALKM